MATHRDNQNADSAHGVKIEVRLCVSLCGVVTLQGETSELRTHESVCVCVCMSVYMSWYHTYWPLTSQFKLSGGPDDQW